MKIDLREKYFSDLRKLLLAKIECKSEIELIDEILKSEPRLPVLKMNSFLLEKVSQQEKLFYIKNAMKYLIKRYIQLKKLYNG